jgi:hypothetical protein
VSALALLGLTLGACGLFSWKGRPPVTGIPDSASFEEMPEARPAGLGPERPVYRYSIIPGGAYSVSELEEAELQDPVVAAHYAHFDHANLRMVQNPAARQVYVSYRVGDAVYWTRKRLQLPAAETLIADGKNEARARCGNQVSDTPRQPTRPDEPPAAALDDSERVLSAGAANAPWGSKLAPEIFPAAAPAPIAGASAAAPGVELGVSEGSKGSGGGFPAWAGGGGTGLPPMQSVAPQTPAGPIPEPQAPGQPLSQTVPVVWVATYEMPPFTPSPVSSDFPAPGGAPALLSSEPVSTSSSLPPIVPFVPAGGGTGAAGSQPAPPDSGEDNPQPKLSGGSGDNSGQPPDAQPAAETTDSPQVDQPPEGTDAPDYTPEPGTVWLAVAGALAVALWNRRSFAVVCRLRGASRP